MPRRAAPAAGHGRRPPRDRRRSSRRTASAPTSAPPRAGRTRRGAGAGRRGRRAPAARGAELWSRSGSQSTASARCMAIVPSARAWWMRQTSAHPGGARDHVDAPQRPRSVQALPEQARHLGSHRRVVTRVHLHRHDVRLDVEALVVDPDRSRRRPGEPAGQRGRRLQPPRDRRAQVVRARCSGSDQHHLAGVAGDGGALERKDRPILVGEGDGLHRRIVPYHGEAARISCRWRGPGSSLDA